jgi:hypothetical protein
LQLATIAIGVGGLSAVFAVVGAVVLRPLPYDQPEELVSIDVTSSRPPENIERVGQAVKAENGPLTAMRSVRTLPDYEGD